MQISFERIHSFLEKIDPRYVLFASCSAYFGIGVLFGLTLRNYLRTIFLSAIICFFFIKGLEMGKVLTFNWAVFNGLLGLSASAGLEDMSKIFICWVAKNPIQTVSAAVGSLIGFRYG